MMQGILICADSTSCRLPTASKAPPPLAPHAVQTPDGPVSKWTSKGPLLQ